MTFINDIAPHAVKAGKEYNILPSLIIAQAIHESNWGKSGLATKGKNLFGVKGKYKGASITMPTWEVINGKNVTVNAAFAKYPSWYESIISLCELYKNGVSWNRNIYKAVIGQKDYKKAAQAVAKAGYATDPKYAAKVIATIEGHKLTQYDTGKVQTSAKKLESVVEYLDKQGVDSSYKNREKLAKEHGIKGYEGSEKQNLELLKKLKEDKKEEKKVPDNTPSKAHETAWKWACAPAQKYLDGTRPQEPVTREQLATILYRMNNK